ncbi:MAG: hypothetical protein DI556_22005 [Rhodovulum sulfidophilum]|uniref:Uncharacterized protein n=1 Tax=Rhodovulum sulfidophilum TaxID=35806 RepID=A0A2W5N072_RHOSU|nr:MAG: hypothetical protein DI556_22005 [Rhodovulum sulfidophilum]
MALTVTPLPANSSARLRSRSSPIRIRRRPRKARWTCWRSRPTPWYPRLLTALPGQPICPRRRSAETRAGPATTLPFRHGYPTGDGWILIRTSKDDQWNRLRDAMGDEAWRDPPFVPHADRITRRDEFDAPSRTGAAQAPRRDACARWSGCRSRSGPF